MTEEPRGYIVALWGDDGSVDWAYVGDEYNDAFLKLHVTQGYYLIDGRPTEILEFVPVWRSDRDMISHAGKRCGYWREQVHLFEDSNA